MNELEAILTAYRHAPDSPPLFLATVVATMGSTYRRPGARLLLTPDGEITGLISGGCLENDIVQHLRQPTRDQPACDQPACDQPACDQPFVITYDLSVEEDLLWGFGLGCNGRVQVLVESLHQAEGQQLMAFLTECWQQRQPGVLATVFNLETPEPESQTVRIGNRLMLSNQALYSTLPNALLAPIVADAHAALQQASARTAIHRYAVATGWVEVCLEVIRPPTPLLIFGAGRDAIPVATLAKQLGWHVTVVDCRALEVTQTQFAVADQVILTRREILDQHIALTPETLALVMTHHYEDDLAILKVLFEASPAYIGLLGSRQRTQRLLQDYQHRYTALAPEQQQRLYAPVGLDIGAETPTEIAVAVVAEMQAVLTQRQAGFLKHHLGMIHALQPESLD